MRKKLEVGERYLTIHLFGGQIKLAAFKNTDKKSGDKKSDYRGEGIAVWISEKRQTNKSEARDDL